MDNNIFLRPRDIIKLAFQYQEKKFLPYVFEVTPSQKKALTKYYGDQQWQKQITNYIGWVT